MFNSKMTAIRDMLRYARNIGVPCVRVSSAQARGRAKGYAYWGVAMYRLEIARNGTLKLRCTRRATSDRRARHLAEADAEKYDRVRIYGLRPNSDDAADAAAWVHEHKLIARAVARGLRALHAIEATK